MMFNRVLLALDRSSSAWRALPTATDLADRLGAQLELIHVAHYPWEVEDARAEIEAGWRDHQLPTIAPEITVYAKSESTARTIAQHMAEVPGTLLVMDNYGRGRTEIMLGSVTLDVLAATHGPIVAVGHHVAAAHRDELVIPVDGSTYSEAAVTLGAAMATALGARPWVVTNLEHPNVRAGNVLESDEPHRIANHIAALTGREAELEVLHGPHSGIAVADFAASIGARMIVSSSHGRTGWARVRLGSVGAEIVRHAPCPVTLVRPPALPPIMRDEPASMTMPPIAES
jgi:nucleotide-binding universal stress UspA family protein